MSAWTTRQEEILREYGHLGVEGVRKVMLRETSATHSVHAIEQHASIIHASLAKRTVCPGCGTIGVRLNRQSGMCRRCTEQMHLEEERAFNELLEAEAAKCEEVAEVRRERDRLRQKNSRLCRKWGLTPRSKR